MTGYEGPYRAWSRSVRETTRFLARPIVCESALTAALLRGVTGWSDAPLPLALWVLEHTSQLRAYQDLEEPVVIQDSSALARRYGCPDAVRRILQALGIAYVEPLQTGQRAVAAAAEYTHVGLDEDAALEVARRRYDELVAADGHTILALDPYSAAQLRRVAGGKRRITTLRELICAPAQPDG
jgi:Fe-S oxidoreductase